MQRWPGVALLMVAVLILLSCQSSPLARDSPTGSKDAECSNVETMLRGLRTASDPSAYAKEQGLEYRNGKVLVVVELKESGQALPGGYDFDEQSRQGNLIQGFIRVEQLCTLAAESQVSRIRVPAIPQPLR